MKTKLTRLFSEFLHSEQASGIILIVCTLFSLSVANSPLGQQYLEFWHAKLGFEAGGIKLKHSLEHWINDGLMAVFFLLIGLEIKRELRIGELSNLKSASLPLFAAIGGMVTPAAFHLLLNFGTETQGGAGIPMATDIAFALGALALLGSRVPVSLKIFLTALAIIDDLGAIIVIALFYVGDFSSLYLIMALAILAGLLALNRLGVRPLPFYLLPGLLLWYCMLKSGIHATLAGVMLAFAIPFGQGEEGSPSYRMQHFLHRPVAFGIMPLFALVNTGIALPADWLKGLSTANSAGIFAGLCIGKPLGIALFSLCAVKLKVSQLPGDVDWRAIVGAGFLGGIGFTMSIFITLLAFRSSEAIQSSKITILLSSLLAGTAGYLILRRQAPKPEQG
jgi:NhaA family Na+:H+ antiporter